MKICLMSLHSHGTNSTVPPIGLGYIASLARDGGHIVDLCGPLDVKLGDNHLQQYLRGFKPDVLGVSVFSCDIDTARDTLRVAKETLPEIVTVLGGPHPSCAPATLFDAFPDLDYAFRGEAEAGFLAFLEALEDSSQVWSLVPGLIWRTPDGKTVMNERGMVEHLDDLAFPAWDLMEPRRYMTSMYFYTPALPAPPIVATRGCPFKCTFCANHCITGRRVRKRSVENIMRELRMLKEQYNIRGFQFVDDNVAFDSNLLANLCDRIIEEQLDLEWSCPVGLRIGSVNENLIQKMEHAGCTGISMGIESGSQRVLDMTMKSLTLGDVWKTVEMIRRVTRMRILGHFILGFPTETREEIDKTIDLACALPLDLASFYLLKPVPGTEIWHQLESQGVIDSVGTFAHWDWRNSLSERSYCELSRKELNDKYREAYYRFYLRLPIIMNMLKSVRTRDQMFRIMQGVKRLFTS